MIRDNNPLVINIPTNCGSIKIPINEEFGLDVPKYCNFILSEDSCRYVICHYENPNTEFNEP